MDFKTTRYGRKTVRPDRMQPTETVCDDDYTDNESDFDSDSEDYYSCYDSYRWYLYIRRLNQIRFGA